VRSSCDTAETNWPLRLGQLLKLSQLARKVAAISLKDVASAPRSSGRHRHALPQVPGAQRWAACAACRTGTTTTG